MVRDFRGSTRLVDDSADIERRSDLASLQKFLVELLQSAERLFVEMDHGHDFLSKLQTFPRGSRSFADHCGAATGQEKSNFVATKYILHINRFDRKPKML